MNIIKEARELLNSVPKEEFIINEFTDGIGKCCALGHYNRLKSENPKNYTDEDLNDWVNQPSNKLRELTKKFIEEKHSTKYSDISTINNNDYINGYTEDNPKDRVIHLLDDMIAAGYE